MSECELPVGIDVDVVLNGCKIASQSTFSRVFCCIDQEGLNSKESIVLRYTELFDLGNDIIVDLISFLSKKYKFICNALKHILIENWWHCTCINILSLFSK